MAKETKSKKNKVKKIIDWVITGIFGTLIVVLLGIQIYQKVSGDTFIFGNQYPVVLTDSMEPDYKVNDILVIEKVDPSEIKEGDDISFNWDLTGNGDVYSMTHRVQTVTYYEDITENDGYHYTFVTHGINSNSTQCSGDCTYQTQTFHENVLIGKVKGKSNFLTFCYKAFKSWWSLLILILIPSLYLITTSVIDICKGLDDKPEEVTQSNENNALSKLSKKDIERLKKQMLEEMINAKKGETKSETEEKK